MKRLLIPALVAIAACTSDGTTPSSPDAAAAPPAAASGPCSFTTSGNVMRLDASCTTSTSIVIPDGFTLDGGGKTITAVDPGPGSPFLGAVVRNGGAVANVVRLNVQAAGLASVCQPSAPTDNRLRGILFEGASGSITHSTVTGINKGASGCQEGNAIEVRNAPFDGTHPNTQNVEIAHNSVFDYQKTGILCNGDAVCSVHHNDVGASATQANLAANSVQFGFGSNGDISLNKITGNSWCGPSDFVATAILLFDSGTGIEVSSNRIDGNSDLGIYAGTSGAVISDNHVDDIGADCNVNLYDTAIGDYGASYPDPSNSLTKNKVSGFDLPYDPPVSGGKNQVKKPKGAPAGG